MGIEREKRLGLYGLTPEAKDARLAELAKASEVWKQEAEKEDKERRERLRAQGVGSPKFGFRPDKPDEKQPWMEEPKKA